MFTVLRAGKNINEKVHVLMIMSTVGSRAGWAII